MNEQAVSKYDRSTFQSRGRPVFGTTLGIIILDTRFRRFNGDIGFAGSLQFPVQYAIAKGVADGAKIKSDQSSLQVFTKAIDELVAVGVDGIATSCGFLAVMQPQLQAYSPVPIATSSLLQIPLIERILPAHKRVGILTADAAALTEAHLWGAGVYSPAPVVGLPGDSTFLVNMRDGNTVIDRRTQELEVLAAVEELVSSHTDIGAILLECTNLAPYSATIEARFGLPVYDIMTLLHWFYSGLRPRRYE
ncbi:aspartate/glutamate racemase family protein (plasmid) [Rhizobium sp. 32-5/1]|uniref:aspartate/glutamate racemase family protein n=1 Tax=Rhizobium sp. 32-5/1 TaxID=3019602 RepID=UPI00240DC6A8|nr:aspartate/glutamate racemase family protein [Rhizobium sp. 32-5/1]WEZ85363.1 aspartate/glutamate racemase family protein [Rhizobium sp. 32-5/1]